MEANKYFLLLYLLLYRGNFDCFSNREGGGKVGAEGGRGVGAERKGEVRGDLREGRGGGS